MLKFLCLFVCFPEHTKWVVCSSNTCMGGADNLWNDFEPAPSTNSITFDVSNTIRKSFMLCCMPSWDITADVPLLKHNLMFHSHESCFIIHIRLNSITQLRRHTCLSSPVWILRRAKHIAHQLWAESSGPGPYKRHPRKDGKHWSIQSSPLVLWQWDIE